MKATLNDLEERLEYTFRSKKKLEEALRHSSIKDEDHPSNERLEFLGDAVLGLAVTEYVYKTYPDLSEGELTAIKSVVVSSESLLKIARRLKLRQFLAVGKGITKKRTIPQSLVANAVEALIGAIYLDSGFRAARRFALSHVEPMVGRVVKKRNTANYKSQLQNYVQKKFGATPHYRLVTENGPDHKKTFELTAVVCDRTFPVGLGKTKKIASQQAARKALKILQSEYGKLPTASF
jgi:ribonuclease-3